MSERRNLPGWARPLVLQQHRYKVMHGGRGGGKSWAVAMALLLLGVQAPIRVLCAREIQKSMRDSVHRLLRDQVVALGVEAFYEVLEAEIRGKNGTVFLFSGLQSHTVDSIKSFEGVTHVWVEEAHGVSKKSWDVLIPTIRREGSEIWLTLNPDMETDETYQRFIARPSPDTWVRRVNWRDNPWFPQVLDAERLKAKEQDPEAYRNIWEGEPKRTLEGAIYAREVQQLYSDDRVCNVPHDPRLPVHTVWDLGWGDAMVVMLVQRTPLDFRVIDYIEGSHQTLEWYVGELEKLPYRWGTDFMPHDAQHGDFKTGTTAAAILQDMGRDVQVLERAPIEAGIRLARGIFPRAYIDAKRCDRLLECLKRYRRTLDVRTNLPGAPLHDEYSHGADAWRYLAVALPLMEDGLEQRASVLRRRSGGMSR